MVKLNDKMIQKKTIKTIPSKLIPSKSGSTGNISANIKVVVRVRPVNTKEDGANSRAVVQIIDDKMLIFDPKEEIEPFFYQGVKQQNRNFLKRANKQMKFMFNCVFGDKASNQDIFESTTKDTILALMDGFNCSVFVYGATGAGKTFTMIGKREEPGITYLTMEELFRVISTYENEREFDIGVSYLEVYNENVLDLLKPSKTALQLREDSTFGVVVAGLTVSNIRTAQELLHMLEEGNKNRTQHPTDANSESSRSHAVFQVYVKMRYKTTGQASIVKLSMIDLAGSERASATGCVGERFKEGANINRSLLALGNCINKLADGSKFIPYRDSKLTRLLKDSLGGNCQTIMIANVSPSSLSYEDTYNTLKYAARASKIQSSIKKNNVSCDLHVSQYVKMVEELTKQVRELQAQLANGGSAKTVTSAGIVIKKEPEESAVNSDTKRSDWMLKIEEAFKAQNEVLSSQVALMSKQRVLMMRQRLKQRAIAQLSCFCEDAEDDDMMEIYRKDVSRQESAMQSFSRQVINLQKKIESQNTKCEVARIKFTRISTEATSAYPDLKDFVDKIKTSSELNIAKASVTHKKRLLEIVEEEISSSNSFIAEMPSMLKRFYLILKGYGKVTEVMTEKYVNLIRNVKGSRGVTWADEQDNNQEQIDSHFNYYMMDNITVENISEVASRPVIPFESRPHGINRNSLRRPLQMNVNELNMTPIESNPCRKRKATPSAVGNSNNTIVLDDSLEEMGLDSTHVITPTKRKLLEGSIQSFNSTKDSDLMSGKENDGSKVIDPKDLNSTFVLAGKQEASLPKKALVRVPVQAVKGLAQKVPFRSAPSTSDKAKPSKPIVGKALPFRRPLPPTPAAYTRPAFGSAAVKSTPTTNKTPNSIQVGLKAVTRPRDKIKAPHPYARPAFSRR